MTRNPLCLVAVATLSTLACASTHGGAFGLAYPASSAGELAAVEARARAAAAPQIPAPMTTMRARSMAFLPRSARAFRCAGRGLAARRIARRIARRTNAAPSGCRPAAG